MKIHPFGTEFHVERWTDMTMVIVTFRNVVNVFKKRWIELRHQACCHFTTL